MGEMNIKIKDERMLERLSDLAKEHNRSPESELWNILEQGLGLSDSFDLVKEARRIAAMTPKGIKQTDSTVLVREDREDPDR